MKLNVLLPAVCLYLSSIISHAQPAGSVVAWGDNSGGQTNMPSDLANVVAVSGGGSHSMALKFDGSVVVWGNTGLDVPAGLGNVVAIGAGLGHCLAAKRDGTVVAWGLNDWNQCDVPEGLSNVVAVSGGSGHSTALTRDGKVIGWGANNAGQSMVPSDLTNVLSISAGGHHNLALLNNGTVVAYGYNLAGQVSPLPGQLNDVVAVAAGWDHSLALKRDGTVISWGSMDQASVPADLSHVVAISAGQYYSMALTQDGSIVTWGSHPTVPPGLVSDIISAGWRHALSVVNATPVWWNSAGAVNGVLVIGSNVLCRGAASVSLRPPPLFGTILFTLDGSDPKVAGRFYEGPFSVGKTSTLRAIAYSFDFSRSILSDSLVITVLPALTSSTLGGGSLTIDPPSGAYFPDQGAIVTATPAPGWQFLNWLGDAKGNDAITRVMMTRDKHVQAVFGTTVSNVAIGAGVVKLAPASAFIPYGTIARVTAIPNPGSYFVQWGTELQGTNTPINLMVINPSPKITAIFGALLPGQRALTVIENGPGHVTASPLGNRFGNGTNVTLRAVAGDYQQFTGWSGDASGTRNPLVVTMNQSRIITANFTKKPTLRVSSPSEGMIDGGFRLTLLGEFEAIYSILGSTNFADWTPVGSVTNTFGTVQITDETANGWKIYRAVAQ